MKKARTILAIIVMVLAIIVMTPLKAAQFAFEILAYYVWTGAQWIADKLNSTRQ